MEAEIITIGDEILIGQIVDTNSAYIATELNKIGFSVREINSIQDEKNQILSVLGKASKKADLVIITGGLGPTNDDITRQTLCEYFEDELVLHEETLENIKKLYARHNRKIVSELDRNQALLPSKAQVLKNEHGTAAGMWFEKNDIIYVSMPGVPLEMKGLMENHVLPRLQSKFKTPFIKHKTARVYGQPESVLAEKIESWENSLPEFIKLAYLPGKGLVRLRLTARGIDEQVLKEEIDTQFSQLKNILGNDLKSYDDEDSVQVQIAKILTERNMTLATAESCTGGTIAATFTENAGASKYFKGSVVSYATSIKHKLLNIPKELIEEHSVVSAEVAEAMAKNIQQIFKVDYAISTTGNAGPSKGDSDAEVGTVFIGLATPEKISVFKYNFGKNREQVLGKTLNKSLELMLDELL